MYVLVAHGPSNNDVPIGEKRWSEILDKEQNEFLEKHHAYIIGWMEMTTENQTDIPVVKVEMQKKETVPKSAKHSRATKAKPATIAGRADGKRIFKKLSRAL